MHELIKIIKRKCMFFFHGKEKGIISKKSIIPFLPVNPVIVEAGAHIGIDTVEMSKIWPSSQIYAFEPVTEIYEKLKINTSACKNVTCYMLALGNKNDRAKMYVSSGRSDASSSLLRPKEHLQLHPDVFFDHEIDVETITLDYWAETKSIKKIDLLWLDLQGFELDVLKSAKNILNTVKVICTEVNLIENYEGTSLYGELRDYLSIFGLCVFKEELAWKDGGNVIFVKYGDNNRIDAFNNI